MTTFQILFSPEVFASTLRIMIPLMFVSLGGLIVARSGIENIGLEGLMLIGCFSGLVFNYYTESWIWGLVGSHDLHYGCRVVVWFVCHHL